MYLRRLVLRDFRVYEELALELSAGLTWLVGSNAAGKTSVLEAIHFLATSKSPRTLSDMELVRWGETSAHVQGIFRSHEGQPLQLGVRLNKAVNGPGGGKHLEVDGQPVASARELISRAPVVMFGPDDLGLIKTGPGRRRRFLNTALAQLAPRYLDDLTRYRRALRQRNQLLRWLREGRGAWAALHPWTEQLVRSGAAVVMDRRRLVGDLQRHAQISHGERLDLAYRTEVGDADSAESASESLRRRLADLAEGEARRGTTLAGPHRDDLLVRVNGTLLRTFGSQGQQRTAALSLKLAQARVTQEWTEEPPLLLLDDCLSELDENRARAVLELGLDLDGMIVTSTGLDEALAQRAGAARFEVSGGQVRPA